MLHCDKTLSTLLSKNCLIIQLPLRWDRNHNEGLSKDKDLKKLEFDSF